MTSIVPGSGPLDARLVVIGEAPGPEEMKYGRPFIGKSGDKLTEYCSHAGIDRAKVRIDNVCQTMPPEVAIENFSPETIKHWINDFHRRMAQLVDPWLIVPVGNLACYALTGRGKVKGINNKQGEPGILSLRGSIMSYFDMRGREIKVIPTLHPAFILRENNQGKYEARTLRDWERIAGDVQFRALALPARKHTIWPTEEEFARFVDRAVLENNPISIDIETRIDCIGFALSPWESITVPIYSKELLEKFLPCIKHLLGSPNEKILQNGGFDTYVLKMKYGLDVRNYIWDTRWMHHTLDAREEHSLEFLTSIYTREPYYKDEGSGEDGSGKLKNKVDYDEYFRYNGKDCCVTHEIYHVLRRELEREGLMDFYLAQYAEMFGPMLETTLHGVRVAREKQKEWREGLLRECQEIRGRLSEIAGEDLWVKTGFSTKKLHVLFYETLKAKPVIDRKTKKPKLDEAALLSIAGRKGSTVDQQEAVRLLLRFRELKGEADQLGSTCDKDERMRCQYGWVETGRFKSAENPMGTGRNLQNIKR